MPFRYLATQKAEHFANDLVQVERDSLNGSPLEKRTDAPHHLSGLIAVADDAFGGLICLGQVRLAGREKAQAGVTARYHGS